MDVEEESNHLEVTGTLTITDNDLNDVPRFNPTGVFTSLGSTGVSALGTLAITETGLWTYMVNNDLVQHLNTGEVITERYSVTSTDGAEHIIEIAINGTNDVPVATGFSVDASGEPHQSGGAFNTVM
ncbi:VCBS domain-containing protein [Vibrio splendidus]|uniref:VCBS domain-containing protein n=1 Tax=Vibrio splendidus TaxID=29497 RepID=UPI003D6633AC